jgi:ribonuclease HI
MKFEVYTDGSATTADKPGGFAFVIIRDGVKVSEGSGHLQKATNNVAEITAAIRGLEALQSNPEYAAADSASPRTADVVLISDSQLVLRYATGEYQCRKYHLIPLYIALRKNFQKTKATTRWVKGHSGDEHNERCDMLAKAARTTPVPANICDPSGAPPVELPSDPGSDQGT